MRFRMNGEYLQIVETVSGKMQILMHLGKANKLYHKIKEFEEMEKEIKQMEEEMEE